MADRRRSETRVLKNTELWAVRLRQRRDRVTVVISCTALGQSPQSSGPLKAKCSDGGKHGQFPDFAVGRSGHLVVPCLLGSLVSTDLWCALSRTTDCARPARQQRGCVPWKRRKNK
jgi:hypothetical protein